MNPRVRLVPAAGPLPIPGPALARPLTAVLRRLTRRPVAVSVVLVDDRTIRRLNREFLGRDCPTDVIAFPLRKISDFRFQIADYRDRPRRKRARRLQSNICNLQSAIPWGEVYVSVTTARREAKARGIPIEEELLRYAVHGLLHLFGYDDKATAQRRRMWRRQEALLANVLTRPKAATKAAKRRRAIH